MCLGLISSTDWQVSVFCPAADYFPSGETHEKVPWSRPRMRTFTMTQVPPSGTEFGTVKRHPMTWMKRL